MQRSHSLNLTTVIVARLKDYSQLMKFRLSVLVVFSSGIGYLMGMSSPINWEGFFMICIGGMLTAGASNTLNQVIEKDFDKLMKSMN